MREVPGRPQDLCGGLLGSGDILQGTEADLRVALAVRADLYLNPQASSTSSPTGRSGVVVQRKQQQFFAVISGTGRVRISSTVMTSYCAADPEVIEPPVFLFR